MDLYAIHKAYMDMQSDYANPSSSTDSVRDSMARLHENILLRLFKGRYFASGSSSSEEPPCSFFSAYDDDPCLPGSLVNIRPSVYDSQYDPTDSVTDYERPLHGKQKNSSIEFNAYQQLTRPPNGSQRDFTSFGQPRVTLADQFTWGAVVCAGVFIVVFVCVMAAWWVHKKQQDRIRSRIAESEAAQRPYCIENDPRGQGTDMMDVQRPPSYFEVIGFFDPPPSYNDILRVNSSGQLQNLGSSQAYDNVAVTIDELPPPFAEEVKSEMNKADSSNVHEASAIVSEMTNSTVTVINVCDERVASSNNS